MTADGKERHRRSARLCAVLLFSCAVSLALVAWDGNSEGVEAAAAEQESNDFRVVPLERNGIDASPLALHELTTKSRSLSAAANSFDHDEYWAVCGRSGRCSSAEPNGLHPALSLHEVRCCSDTPISGWYQPPGCPHVTSYLGGPRGPGCYDGQTHSAAAAICEENGARLCTRQELLDDCTRFTGCGHDQDLIWSSTKCREAGETCGSSEDCCGGRTCLGSGHCEGYATPAPTPVGCDTCLLGRVGHWNFDELSSGFASSSDGTTIIERGSSEALVGVDASITGSGSISPLVADGKFGSALVIPAGTANYAQMSSSGLVQSAPSNGFASSIWILPETGSFSPQGIVFERKYNNLDLYTQEYTNLIGCRVRDESGTWHRAEYSFGSTLDATVWYHIVCSYDHVSQALTLYVDGLEQATTAVAFSSFTHANWYDNDMQLGVGNRPSSTSGNPGQSAGNSHFVGVVDDFVLWDRPLSAEEVALLYASDRAVEDQGDGVVASSPTADPSNHPTVSPSSSPTIAPTPHPTVISSNSPSADPTSVPLLWSDPSTWPSGSVPGEGDSVIIPDGVIIALDVTVVPSSGSLGDLTIEGTLVNHGNDDLSLSASSIVITETGTLQIGSSTQPYEGQASITLTGAPDPTTTFERSEDNALDNDGTRRVLAVRGGSLIMHSSTPTIVNTKLNENAAAGETTLTLADGVDWRAGDLIAVSTTDYYFGENHYSPGDTSFAQTEVLEIAADTIGSSQVTLSDPLQNNRWGALQYVTNAGMSLSPGLFDAPSPLTPRILDERAEVIHLSRNIVVQGADDAHWQNGFGLHVIISGASPVAQIEGVMFLRGGQRRTMGRYPFHWHMLSASTGENIPVAPGDHFLRRSVVLESENRAVTIHGTSGVVVDSVFAVDIKNHAFFFEDGSETGNVVTNCFAMKVRNRLNEHLKNHDRQPSGFWLTNPDNVITGNSASDIQGVGLWNSFSTNIFGASASAGLIMNPASLPVAAFDDNVAHGCQLVGIQTEFPVIDEAGNTAPRTYRPDPDGSFVMSRNIIWKSNNGGYQNRVSRPIYNAWTVADNTGRDIFGATDHHAQIVGNLFVSQSLNNEHTHLDVPNPAWNFQPRRRGVASYHFSADISNVTAIGYSGVDDSGDRTPQITPNGQFVYAPGFIDLSDLYTDPISVGTWRCGGWKLIDSNPGYLTRTPASIAPEDDPTTTDVDESLPHDTFPKSYGSPQDRYRHWPLSGALWDPHGYFGPAGNYAIATPAPFFTYGLSNGEAVPPGTLSNPINGISTPDRFFGINAIRPFTHNQWWEGSTDVSTTMDRLDENGVVVDSLFLGDDCSSSIFHFRHYALKSGGIYRLRLFTDTYSSCSSQPEAPAGTRSSYDVTNGYRSTDTFLIGLPWPSSANECAVSIRSWNNVVVPLSDANVNSFADIRDSSERAFWRDASNDMVWVKYVGGIDPLPDADDFWTDHELFRHHTILLTAVA